MAPLVRDRLVAELAGAAVSLGALAVLCALIFVEERQQLVADVRDAWRRRLERVTWPATWPSSPPALFARGIRARLIASEMAEPAAVSG